jgi:SAM-dependent MidA family methyltransferase
MTRLKAQLIDQIKREGPISLAQFMSCALYDPALGYYASGRAKIGKSGDFYTNVSVGPLFGKLLARQFARMWRLLGKPHEWTLVEQGAFDGSLANDVLSAMAQQDPDCYEATKLTIIEPFAALQEAQSSTLKKHLEKATWKETLASCPPFTGVHYSNELLDAFPAHQVRYTQGRWVERCVGFDGSALVWIESELNNPAVSDAVKRLTVPEEGASREVCPLQEGWLRELDLRLRHD